MGRWRSMESEIKTPTQMDATEGHSSGIRILQNSSRSGFSALQDLDLLVCRHEVSNKLCVWIEISAQNLTPLGTVRVFCTNSIINVINVCVDTRGVGAREI